MHHLPVPETDRPRQPGDLQRLADGEMTFRDTPLEAEQRVGSEKLDGFAMGSRPEREARPARAYLVDVDRRAKLPDADCAFRHAVGRRVVTVEVTARG